MMRYLIFAFCRLSYGNAIKSPLVIHDRTLFMHSDLRVRGRPVLLSVVSFRGEATTY